VTSTPRQISIDTHTYTCYWHHVKVGWQHATEIPAGCNNSKSTKSEETLKTTAEKNRDKFKYTHTNTHTYIYIQEKASKKKNK